MLSPFPIRCAAVDDHDVVLQGLKTILAPVGECEVVGGYSSVTDLFSALDANHVDEIDMVLLDLQLGDGSDPYFNVKSLKEAGMHVLLYSSLSSPYLLRRALRGGVHGILNKSLSATQLQSEVRKAAETIARPPAVSDQLIYTDEVIDQVQLSRRQREALVLYSLGESAKRVAEIMDLSAETVQDYLGRVRQKYALAGRPALTKVDLFRRAQEDGYIAGPWEV